MTPERLDEIQRRANAATAGPWFNDVLTGHVLGTQTPNGESHIVLSGTVDEDDIRDWGEDGKYCTFDTPATKEFVSHARTDIPDLIAEVRRLQSENAELSRLRAAVGHMQQEINTLRSREMNIDDIADYSEDRAKLKAENEQLKLAKAELVESLKKSLNLEYRTRLVCAMDFARTHEDFESRQLILNSLRGQVQAVIAKHEVSL